MCLKIEFNYEGPTPTPKKERVFKKNKTPLDNQALRKQRKKRQDEDNIYVDDVELEEEEEEDEEDRLYMEMALEEEQRSKSQRAKQTPSVTQRPPAAAEQPPLPENSSGCARSEPYRKIPDVEKVPQRCFVCLYVC